MNSQADTGAPSGAARQAVAPGDNDTSPLFGAETFSLVDTTELRGRTALFDSLFSVSLVACVAAIAAQRPEALLLALPGMLAIGLTLARWQPVAAEVRLGFDSAHIVENDEFNLIVEVTSLGPVLGRVEVELELGPGVTATSALRVVTTVGGSTCRRIAFPVTAERWGVVPVDLLRVRITDRLGLFGGEVERRPSARIRIGLPEDRLRTSAHAERFRNIVGSHLSNDRGRGLEIADIGRFQPGDSMRDVNWRITNRRGEPWVTLRHPDRSTTVVIVVDADAGDTDAKQRADATPRRSARNPSDSRDPSDPRDSERRSVSAAMALARGHLANNDPVGLLVVGRTTGWLPPALGRDQRMRVADQLLVIGHAPTAVARYRPRAVDHIPRDALVLTISPLRHPRMVALVAELRSRGNPVSVIAPTVEQPPPSPWQRWGLDPRGTVDTLAMRFADVECELGRRALRSRGVLIVDWPPGQSVNGAVAALAQFRQAAGRGWRATS